MANPGKWKPKLLARLDDEALICVVESIFVVGDGPSNVGLTGITTSSIVFYRKKLLGEEFLRFERSGVVSVEEEESQLTALIGGDATNLRIQLQDSPALTLKSITSDEAHAVRSALQE